MSLEEELSKLYNCIQRARIFADEINRYGLKKNSKQIAFMHCLTEDIEQQYERLYSIIRRVPICEMKINKNSLPAGPPQIEPL